MLKLIENYFIVVVWISFFVAKSSKIVRIKLDKSCEIFDRLLFRITILLNVLRTNQFYSVAV